MKSILKHDNYSIWFEQLRDATAKAKINARLRRVELGSVDVWFADRVCADFGLKQGERRVA